jgi:hypothetical protein
MSAVRRIEIEGRVGFIGEKEYGEIASGAKQSNWGCRVNQCGGGFFGGGERLLTLTLALALARTGKVES